MTITFADGTRIDVPASAFDDFLKHDLKWVEFVHGRASETQLFKSTPHVPEGPAKPSVHRCPAGPC
jgi:hypothetical protein